MILVKKPKNYQQYFCFKLFSDCGQKANGVKEMPASDHDFAYPVLPILKNREEVNYFSN